MLLGRKFVEVYINLSCNVWKRGFRIYGTDLEDSEKNAYFNLEAADAYLIVFLRLFSLQS